MSIESTLQNLQLRLSNAENTIGLLSAQVQRLTQTPSLSTSIPLQPAQGRRPYVPQARPLQAAGPSHAASHAVSHAASHAQGDVPPTLALSEILNAGEVVTFGIFTGRDATGALQTSTAVATFDGTDLTVTECVVGSLVGLKTSKAGEILFKFMNGLKEAGRIDRPFNALPWRLASVVRDGQKVTLAQLRAAKA